MFLACTSSLTFRVGLVLIRRSRNSRVGVQVHNGSSVGQRMDVFDDLGQLGNLGRIWRSGENGLTGNVLGQNFVVDGLPVLVDEPGGDGLDVLEKTVAGGSSGGLGRASEKRPPLVPSLDRVLIVGGVSCLVVVHGVNQLVEHVRLDVVPLGRVGDGSGGQGGVGNLGNGVVVSPSGGVPGSNL